MIKIIKIKARFLLTTLILMMLTGFFPVCKAYAGEVWGAGTECIEISEGWQYRLGDSPLDEKGAPVWLREQFSVSAWGQFQYPGSPPAKGKHHTLWIRNRLPGVKLKNPALLFKSEDQMFEVYLEDTRIYSFGNTTLWGKNSAPGSPWHLIPLPEDFQGKTISLRMYSSLAYSVGTVVYARIAPAESHIINMIKDSIASFVLGALCIFIGLLLVFAYLAEKGKEATYCSLGFFSLSIGVWIESETGIKQILLNNPNIWQYVAFISSYLMPVAFSLFIIQSFDKENTSLLQWLMKIHAGYLAAALVLHTTNLLPIIFTLRLFLILLMTTMGASFVLMLRAAGRGNIKARVFITGFACLAAFSVYDILGWHFKILPWSNHVTHWGMFFFTLSLVYMTVKQFSEVKNTLDDVLEYDKLKTQFFTNISHELRTPLNIILGTVQLLRLYYEGAPVQMDEEKVTRHMGTIRQNCLRLVRLVNNLIDITKIDSGFIRFYPQNCDIVGLVEDITLSAVDYARSKGTQLTFDTDVEEKVMACDPHKIERILLNLLSNAIKFTNPGGKITVSIKSLGVKMQILVKDTGIGISRDKHEMIFERFRQVDGTLTRNHEGSGIGLSLVRSFIEMHDGSISVESQPGVGSCFIVELPVKVVEEHADKEHQVFNDSQQSFTECADMEFSDIYINK